jgi:plastocyanin
MKNLLIVILIIILVGGIYYFSQKSKISTIPQTSTSSTFEITTTQPTQLETSTLNITTTSPTTLSPTATPTTEVIIKITANGFEPKEVEITKGTKVTWINEQSNPSWPASDVHPTHEVYPGSSIKKCGTPEQDKIFDACRGLKQGEIWSFIFNEVGEWYYHDHLKPSWKGEIVVK